MYAGQGIRRNCLRSVEARKKRAENYRQNVEARQYALPEDSLIMFAPYRIVRLARVQCFERGEWKIIGYAFKHGLRKQVRDHTCEYKHSIRERVWGVCGRDDGLTENPLIMEWFHDILMARVLRDDLNLKAATAIMARER